ncbi:hypothetical protein A2837_00155 [Candidatus Kaiserbacteria bacterium RIFCSPHIGHO2_01_FULL_46_22]|uniref:3-keto-disaccharide hydrolase domain-containing protein n=1 Tax=Candidatus Kaiserbacteria bacterium RIFCSPHIGHO2_01_FULL_46_22 TaxID=1798475 RepID=A0A1F6BXP4_9BACT|nr:MAG: hypothetical protein A2837_00155 [Candidatus Kaiserbacteria bacterium RIFCSPHIGHO2_01_FULL_46_22]
MNIQKLRHNLLAATILALLLAALYLMFVEPKLLPAQERSGATVLLSENVAEANAIEDDWLFNFDSAGTLQEAASPELSSSRFWWLSSGGNLVIEGGTGRTARKDQSATNRWSLAYRLNNSLDTDSGRYPQNLFRLVSRDTAADADIAMSFRILSLNLTDTPNRDAWSGVFLFSRYQDSDNLYYAGVRQDGHVVIKKKIGGKYYTMAEEEHFRSYRPYEKDTNPNLIPGQSWLEMRLTTKNESDGLRITLSIKDDSSTSWKEVLEVLDKGTGGPAFDQPGHFGIRTDYMDVEFDNYRVNPI